MIIVAEAGTSHSGSLEKGKKLIEKAALAGADAVKFQVVFADEIIHPLTGSIDLPGGKTRLYDVFRSVEKDEEFYRILKQEAENNGILFVATPFGIKSARLLKNIRVKMIKIASPELNHYPLLREVSSWNIRLVLSGGVSRLGDIEKAVEITGKDITFLHCITSYPAPEEEYNLSLIKNLSAVFGFRTGVSDHSRDPLLVPLISAALGAAMLEKHFTLDRKGGGLDDAIALEPEEFRIMVSEARKISDTHPQPGPGIAVNDYETSALEGLRKRFGSAKIDAVTGDGIKKLAPSEKANYGTTNRSLISLKKILPGETIGEADFAPLRSEKNIKPGLSPEFARLITGKKVCKTIENGEGITFNHFITDGNENT